VPPAAAAPPEGGWLATGDLGEFDAAGHLRITGRLRDTLVLSTGVKLPPAEVERALAEDDAVAQVCVVGDGLPWPVALVVPEPTVVRAAIARMGVRVFSRAAALSHPRVVRWLARRLDRRQRLLPRAWRVRRVVLVGRPFDAAHGEATESFKLRRDAIAAHFRGRIAAAAADPVPAGIGSVPPSAEAVPVAGSPWVAAATWESAAGGFAAAAERAATAPADAMTAVVDRAVARLARLRAEGTLYDAPVGRQPAPPAPLADAPPPPAGKFSRVAEEALGDVGLWGLAAPESCGGAGAGMLDLARAITRLAADCPTAAGMLAVHSTIGAVTAVAAFGTPAQRSRHLPSLAAGRPLSIFGGTEPDVGCDLAAVRAVLHRRPDGLALEGTKMFITNAVHGRLVKTLALLDGRPVVALVRLPEADGPGFRLRHYDLHPLKHAHNAALEFDGFPVEEADLLAAPEGRDGMHVVWHGLNRGRVTLAAQAAGTLRLLLAHACDHARRRTTWGRPIASRELVQGRLGRIAARIAACDALAAWAATAIDLGGTGELEAITAKIVAGESVRDSALDALGVHGGRAFLVGHPLGDSLHDHLAVTVYEGESDLLGLALFKGLAKHHPLARLGREAPALRRAAGWLAWRAAGLARGDAGRDRGILDARLRGHARRARRLLARTAGRIDAALRRHGRNLAERQLEVGALAATVRDLTSVLAVAHHADASGDDAALTAGDCWCRLALARAAGVPPAADDHAAVAALGRVAVAEPADCRNR
jgi:alkylation response protein AidB-like acyl-CoA dehydrogenase